MPRFLFYFLILGLMLSALYGMPKAAKAEKKQGLERVYTGGENVKVIAFLSSEEIGLLDLLEFEIRIEAAESIRVTEPVLTEEFYYPFVLAEPVIKTKIYDQKTKRFITRYKLLLEPLEAGDFRVGGISIFYRLDAEKKNSLDQWPLYRLGTKPFQVRVSAPDASSDLMIRSFDIISLPPVRLVPILLGVTVVLGLFSGVFFLLRTRQNITDEPAQVEMQPDEKALLALAELEKMPLGSLADFNRFHSLLSGIFREFVEARLGIRAMEQTTEEFVRELTLSDLFSAAQKELLYQFLELADLVKFASFDPGDRKSKEALGVVRDFVESFSRGRDEV